MENCLYLRERTGTKYGEQPIHNCLIHGECVKQNGGPDMVGCDDCRDRLQIDDPELPGKWRDPLRITDRLKQPTHALRNLLAGGSAFLLCSGPSANSLPLERLSERGYWSLAVNNMAGHAKLKPQAFICADPPKKFSYSIWRDPGVMKFAPTPKFLSSRNKLRRKEGRSFVDAGRVTDCPNVWGYERRSWFLPDNSFFTEPSASWGNLDSGVKRTGLPKTAATMLCAIRLLYYLGARTIYLIGADFRMAPTSGYSFDQARTDEACASNNRQFQIVNQWLVDLTPTLDTFGLEIYNCYDRSGLRAFPYTPFDSALEQARGTVEAMPDLAYWYEKVDREPENK